MNIRAIGFDFGGVVGLHKGIMSQIAGVTNVPKEDLKAEYFRHNKLANLGKLSYPELWKIVLKKFDKTQHMAEVVKLLEFYDRADLDTNVLNLIGKLKANNYKVGLLTNNTLENGHRLKKNGLDKYFDVFLVSAEIGFQKPDPKAFEVLFSALGVSPQESVYIDDSSNSLLSAGEVGFTPILFTGYENLLKQLSELNISIN